MKTHIAAALCSAALTATPAFAFRSERDRAKCEILVTGGKQSSNASTRTDTPATKVPGL